MGLLQGQLGGVLNGDDPLSIRNHSGQRIEEGRLAGAGSAGDENIEPGYHQDAQEVSSFLGQAVAGNEIRKAEGLREPSNGDCRPIERKRWNNDVDTLSAGETRVHHRAGFVHSTVDRGDDAINELIQLGLGCEAGGNPLDPSGSLDEDVLHAVDHDLGDGMIRDERLEHPQPDGVVDHSLDEPCPLAGGHDGALEGQNAGEHSLQTGSLLGEF